MRFPLRFLAVLIIAFLAVLSGCAAPAPPAPRPLDGSRLKLAWTYASGGPINLPPVVAGGVVLVIPQDGPLLALDAKTGGLAWRFDPPQGLWDRALAAADGQVYVGLKGGLLAALDARSGALLWQSSLGVEVQAPPAASGGRVYVPSTFVGPGLAGDPTGQARLFALDAKTGESLWSFQAGAYILQTPFIDGNQLFTGGSYADPQLKVDEGGPMRLYALSVQDGSQRWSYQSTDGYVKAIYAAGGYVSYIAYTDYLSGLDAASGKLLWRQETGNWVPSLSGHQQTLYFGAANTVVQARAIQDGSVIWSYNIPGGSFNYLLGAPVRVTDDLYCLTQRGDLFALDAANGSLRWSQATGVTARVGLSVGPGAIYLGDADGVVYAYSDQ